MHIQPANEVISIIGGTGKEGIGLALRFAIAGFKVLLGSRNPTKALETQEYIETLTTKKIDISGLSNEIAVAGCHIALLTVPYQAHEQTLLALKELLKGKVLVDVTVPLNPPKVFQVKIPKSGSAAQEAYQLLGDQTKIAAAFHNISSENLITIGNNPDCDVLVTGIDQETRQVALDLVQYAGFTGWDAGPLENSIVLEGLTSILIGINRKYGSRNAGIRITGVTKQD